MQCYMKGEREHTNVSCARFQVGDYLIAVDQYNTTNAPAKAVHRLMSALAWPRILVFETKGLLVDPTLLEKNIRMRTYNVTVIYPPPLISQFQVCHYALV